MGLIVYLRCHIDMKHIQELLLPHICFKENFFIHENCKAAAQILKQLSQGKVRIRLLNRKINFICLLFEQCLCLKTLGIFVMSDKDEFLSGILFLSMKLQYSDEIGNCYMYTQRVSLRQICGYCLLQNESIYIPDKAPHTTIFDIILVISITHTDPWPDIIYSLHDAH